MGDIGKPRRRVIRVPATPIRKPAQEPSRPAPKPSPEPVRGTGPDGVTKMSTLAGHALEDR
jgi:hypothetical protein